MLDDYSSIWAYRAKWAYLLAVVGALLAPVFYIIYISFNEHGFGARIYEFTFDWYVVVLGDTSMPGRGFFSLARELDILLGDDELEFFVGELKRVHEHWGVE